MLVHEKHSYKETNVEQSIASLSGIDSKLPEILFSGLGCRPNRYRVLLSVILSVLISLNWSDAIAMSPALSENIPVLGRQPGNDLSNTLSCNAHDVHIYFVSPETFWMHYLFLIWLFITWSIVKNYLFWLIFTYNFICR